MEETKDDQNGPSGANMPAADPPVKRKRDRKAKTKEQKRKLFEAYWKLTDTDNTLNEDKVDKEMQKKIAEEAGLGTSSEACKAAYKSLWDLKRKRSRLKD